ncbi:MAG: hypothetical protein CL917_13120 [Deltaproteobacteria bacterium]|nr:hypothetical protein [Deltaproteobacteria bacterium]
MNRLNRWSVFAVCTVLALVWACATPMRTSFDRDPNADFTRYRTFAWVGPAPLARAKQGTVTGSFVSALDDQRLRRAVDRALQSRGYTLITDTEKADLVVAYSVGTEDKVRVHQTPSSMTVYPYPGRYRYGSWYTGSTVNVQQYTEGTLTLEVYDRRTEQAVWVGWASRRLSRKDDSQKIINEAVSKILSGFPRVPTVE